MRSLGSAGSLLEAHSYARACTRRSFVAKRKRNKFAALGFDPAASSRLLLRFCDHGQLSPEVLKRPLLSQQLLVFIFSSGPDWISTRTGWQTLRRVFRFLSLCLLSLSSSLSGEFFFCRRFSIFFGIRLRIFVFLASLEMMLWCGLLGWTTFSVAKLSHLLSWRLCGRKLQSYVHEAITRPSLKFALRSRCQPLIIHLLCSPVVGDSVLREKCTGWAFSRNHCTVDWRNN
jgi:hypothetical protein